MTHVVHGAAAALIVAAVVGSAAQGAPQQGAPQQGAAQQDAGRAGAAGPAGGRGARNCPTPAIAAAESCISDQLQPANWANPPLPDGPIAIQSALNQHRDLRITVIKGFVQPWSMAWLPDGTMLFKSSKAR